MKSIVFNLDIAKSTYSRKELEENEWIHIYEFIIPILPAFAIEYHTLQFGDLTSFPKYSDSIINNRLTIRLSYDLLDIDTYLIIHYHSVRNYELLFPFVLNSSQRKRLGLLYYEAETAFENGLWFSFIVMCAAVFEGILSIALNANRSSSFESLIEDAKNNNLIDVRTGSIIDMVRTYRNAIHIRRHNEPFITRTEAIDVKSVLDKLIIEWKLTDEQIKIQIFKEFIFCKFYFFYFCS